MVVLDSMGGKQKLAVTKILLYLHSEWKSKMSKECEFSPEEIRVLRPKIPEQKNLTDCGVYLLEYMEKILSR